MDTDFWQKRWQDGQIGFHQDRATPLLETHWQAVGVPSGGRVFVPLAGKTLDMLWLAARGHRVLGVELSELAVQQFFAENGLTPTISESRYGRHYAAGAIELIQGDAFGLDAEILADCAGVFDRAALIALPASMRLRYAAGPYSKLPEGCRGLLITLEYPQHEKVGPPFSVVEPEVRGLFERDWRIESLERKDIIDAQIAFREEGVTALTTAAYRLERWNTRQVSERG
ncbi:MAG TPA: thiopurine S-methyltransferase [Luteimonas sp.]|nr:thiopurine S-methyltransferase [Luteimonas sp.]